jgi:hypothetical protein
VGLLIRKVGVETSVGEAVAVSDCFPEIGISAGLAGGRKSLEDMSGHSHISMAINPTARRPYKNLKRVLFFIHPFRWKNEQFSL